MAPQQGISSMIKTRGAGFVQDPLPSNNPPFQSSNGSGLMVVKIPPHWRIIWKRGIRSGASAGAIPPYLGVSRVAYYSTYPNDIFDFDPRVSGCHFFGRGRGGGSWGGRTFLCIGVAVCGFGPRT